MTTLHPSTVPSSFAPEHLGFSERNPVAVPYLFPQSAPWSWPGNWWTAPLGWMRSPINTQYTPMAPSPAQQEGPGRVWHLSSGEATQLTMDSLRAHVDARKRAQWRVDSITIFLAGNSRK